MINKELIPFVHIYKEFLENSIELGIGLKNNIKWEQKPVKIYGRFLEQPRLIYACGEKGLIHEYSGLSLQVHNWDKLINIKNIAEKLKNMFNVPFNSCLINYYRNGKDYISYHSDKETSKKYQQVVTISLGTSRDFCFKTKQEPFETFKIKLNSGDLVYMFGDCQKIYTHSLPKRSENVDWRISLTFRVLDKN